MNNGVYKQRYFIKIIMLEWLKCYQGTRGFAIVSRIAALTWFRGGARDRETILIFGTTRARKAVEVTMERTRQEEFKSVLLIQLSGTVQEFRGADFQLWNY